MSISKQAHPNMMIKSSPVFLRNNIKAKIQQTIVSTPVIIRMITVTLFMLRELFDGNSIFENTMLRHG